MADFRKRVSLATSIALLAVVMPALASGGTGAASDPPDPLAAEIDHWLKVLQSKPDADPMWAEFKPGLQPALERAQEELRNGRRLLALQRLGTPRTNLEAAVYLTERSADQRKEMAAFDAEWKRMGDVLRTDLGTTAPGKFEGMPAFVRALSEAAFPQVRVYYQASLDYGHNTMPDAGLMYLGNAQAQRDLVAFYRTLPAPSPRRPAPPLRSLRPEIDALQAEMLAVYKPPVSIERHGEFISASALLKEARELDAAGLRYGALLRYLIASQQFSQIRPASAPPLTAEAIDSRLHELAARLSAGEVDHGIGRMFLESAQSGLARSAPGSPSPVAASIATDVLPRYFAALEPARPQPAGPEPQVTVTLVRWPYT